MISNSFQNKIPDSITGSLTEFHLLKIEIDKLLQKGAIEQVNSLEPGSFVSCLFTVPKSNGQRHPAINLRQLNKHVYNKKFRMESLGNIRSLLKQEDFMTPKSRCLLLFIFDGKIYCFKVMPFGLNSAPRIFTKLFKPVLRLLRSQRMLLIIYLDNTLLIAPTAILISIQNLCQFVGRCSATRPALRQAPLFYRKIQLSVNKVLSKAGLNKKLFYNQKIPIEFQVRQTLKWWQWKCHTIAQLK